MSTYHKLLPTVDELIQESIHKLTEEVNNAIPHPDDKVVVNLADYQIAQAVVICKKEDDVEALLKERGLPKPATIEELSAEELVPYLKRLVQQQNVMVVGSESTNVLIHNLTIDIEMLMNLAENQSTMPDIQILTEEIQDLAAKYEDRLNVYIQKDTQSDLPAELFLFDRPTELPVQLAPATKVCVPVQLSEVLPFLFAQARAIQRFTQVNIENRDDTKAEGFLKKFEKLVDPQHTYDISRKLQ